MKPIGYRLRPESRAAEIQAKVFIHLAGGAFGEAVRRKGGSASMIGTSI
jgi:hypothetical protein